MSIYRRRWLIATLLFATVTVLLAACGSDPTPTSVPPPAPAQQEAWEIEWDRVVEAANAEGALTIYGPPGTTYRAAVGRFSAVYPGIKVDLFSAGNSDRVSRITSERAANQYLADLWLAGTTPIVTTMKEDGITVPMEPNLILPEVTDTSNWLGNRLHYADTNEPNTVLMFQGGVNVFITYNTDLVDPSEFTEYRSILDPKWKGKVVGTDIRNPGPGGVPSRFIYKHPDLGPEYLTRLFGELDIQLSRDQRQMVDWIVQGVYPIGVFMGGSDINTAISLGLPIAQLPPSQLKEGGALGPGNGAIAMIDRAPHPNAAKVFINWLLSKEGQIAWQEEVKSPSLRTDITQEGLPEWAIPKPGVEYVDGGVEEYSRITRSAIPGIIEAALGGGS